MVRKPRLRLLWENDGARLRNFKRAVLRNIKYSFQENASWSVISSGRLALRFTPSGFMFDGTGSALFGQKSAIVDAMSFLNSSIGMEAASIVSPTLTFEVGQLANYPLITIDAEHKAIEETTNRCIRLSKADWDSQESSWDFKRNPLV